MERDKALDMALVQIDKQYGKGSIMRMGEKTSMAIEAISTGSIALDLALGVGGLPRGRVVEIFGPESSGKSTLAMHVVAEAQRNGGICAYIDAEHAMDPIYKLPQFHRGVDLGGTNTTVVAPAPGTVVEVSTRVGYGNVVVIDHGGRLATVYAHLASAAVTEGQTVVAGQTIATMGHTGFATATHLHYEIRVEGEPIDPEPLLGA